MPSCLHGRSFDSRLITLSAYSQKSKCLCAWRHERRTLLGQTPAFALLSLTFQCAERSQDSKCFLVSSVKSELCNHLHQGFFEPHRSNRNTVLHRVLQDK